MESRNQIFDTFARDYDLFRPRYPEKFARDIASILSLQTGSRILEIGCGSGQATEAFAQLGCRIESLDPSDSMIAIATHRFSDRHNIKFHCLSFEDFEGSPGAYDFIFSANAFHWVKPEIGWRKVAKLLKPHGHFSTLTIKRELEPSVQESLKGLYGKYKSEFSNVDVKNPIPNSPNTALSYQQEYFNLGEKLFNEYEIIYSPVEYIGLMQTMSDHRMLPAKIQSEFFLELSGVCERFGWIKSRNIASAQIFHVKKDSKKKKTKSSILKNPTLNS